MAEAIQPIDPEILLQRLLGEESPVLAQEEIVPAAPSAPRVDFSGNPFEDLLSKAIESLEGVSQSEIRANQLIDGYLRGEVELSDVMVAQSKMNVMVQLAVTTINSAVTTFKEITQMQV